MAVKPKRKMRRRIEAVSRPEQDALLRSRLAEGAAIFPALELGKRSHAAARRNQADSLLVLGHETAKLPKIIACDFLRSSEHSIAVAHGERLYRTGSALRQAGSGTPVAIDDSR